MSKVTECARALGQAILESEEYKTMQLTENEAMSNPEVAAAMERYLEIKQKIDEAMGSADAETIARYSGEMDDAQQAMNALPAIMEMTESRQRFSQMMNQVSAILEFMVMGESAGGGCSGNCGSCGGCH